MFLRLDPVVALEQPRQSRMPDRDVEMVRIIVGDRLPVERPRPKRHTAHHAQVLEAVMRDLVLVGRHHLGDRRRAGLERHEEKAVPLFERDRFSPSFSVCSPGYSLRWGTPTSRPSRA